MKRLVSIMLLLAALLLPTRVLTAVQQTARELSAWGLTDLQQPVRELPVWELPAVQQPARELPARELAGDGGHWAFAVRRVPCIVLEKEKEKEKENVDAFPYYHTTIDNWKNAVGDSQEHVFRLVTEFVQLDSGE